MARLVSRGSRFHAVAALAVATGFGSMAAAAPTGAVPSLARVYGVGVHAYYSGDLQRSYDDLTQAIESGSNDPRVWYFRGLAARKLGRFDEAEADFSTAAARESEAVAEWDVARSLERVQGSDRMAIERHRMRAGVAKQQNQLRAAARRYVESDRRQPEVQRQIRPTAPADDPLNLFTEGADEPAEDDVPEPVAPGPAGDDAAPAEEPVARPRAAPADDGLMADELAAPADDAPMPAEPPLDADPLDVPAADGGGAAEPEPVAPPEEAPAAPAAEEPAGDEPMAEREVPPPADAPSSDVFLE